MQEGVSVEMLFTKVQEESKTGELIPLAKDFYKNSLEYIKTSEQQCQENENLKKQIQNFKKLLADIQARRMQKILLYIAYNKKLPSPVPEEEEQLYAKLRETISSSSMFPESKNTKMKITADIPEVVMQTGEKIGPFSKNQIVEVTDKKEIEFLLNNKLGEII